MKLSELTGPADSRPPAGSKLKLSDLGPDTPPAPPKTDPYSEELVRARKADSTAGPLAHAYDIAEHSVTFGLNEPVLAAGAGLESMARGHGFKAGYMATTEADKEERAKVGQRHPISAPVVDVGAGLLSPVGDLGLAGKGATFLSRLLGHALTGGIAGGVSGGANADPGIKNRLKGAAEGAAIGAPLGAVAPVAVKGAVGAVEHIAAPIVRTLIRGANALSEGLGHGEFLNASKSAASRLRETLKADGVDQKKIDEAINEWARVGAGSPKLHAIAGRNTLALLRAAAEKHEASNMAAQHAADVRGKLLSEPQARAAQLTPNEPRSAAEFRTGLKADQKAEAESNYPPVYGTRVRPDPKSLSPFTTPKGEAALNKAINNATERAPHFESGEQELADLKALKKYLGDKAAYDKAVAAQAKATAKSSTTAKLPDGSTVEIPHSSVLGQAIKPKVSPLKPPPIPEMSAAALDRLSIGTKRTARNLFSKNPETGGAVAMHAKGIDQMLNAIDGMPEAKAAYKTRAEQLRAMKDVKSALTEPKDTFAEKVRGMSEPAKEAARVQVRQSLQNAFGRKSRDVLGGITGLAESPDIKANLTELFGKDEAEKIALYAKFKLDEFHTAQKIDPGHGSQTFGRTSADEAPESLAQTVRGGPMAWATHLLRSGRTLTPSERKALVEMGTGDLPDILAHLKPAKIGARVSPNKIGNRVADRSPWVAGNILGQALAPPPPTPDSTSQ